MPIQINKIPIKRFSERRSKLEALSVQSSLARSWNWICRPCASSPFNSLWWQKNILKMSLTFSLFSHLLLEEEQDEETRDIRLVQAWSGNT